ncbi:MAG: hypothetical protein LBD88_02900 [Candidatus Peribacteria bacterium]|jgi:hypothetical protein|nr:hypothetical protein [Candidatus Peribacteria bacterium]
MKNFLKNYFSTILFIVVGYMFYTNNSYYNDILFYDVKFLNLTINTLDAFNYLMIFYFIVLIPFYLIENEDSKARVVINAIIKKIKDSSYKITPLEKNSIL